MRQAGVVVNGVALQVNISRRTVLGSGGGSWSSRAKKARYGRPKTTTLHSEKTGC